MVPRDFYKTRCTLCLLLSFLESFVSAVRRDPACLVPAGPGGFLALSQFGWALGNPPLLTPSLMVPPYLGAPRLSRVWAGGGGGCPPLPPFPVDFAPIRERALMRWYDPSSLGLHDGVEMKQGSCGGNPPCAFGVASLAVPTVTYRARSSVTSIGKPAESRWRAHHLYVGRARRVT